MDKPLAYSYVRISSKVQRMGHGQKRQEDASREYAEKHGLELVELNDSGISAYHGKNVEKGALGQFLKAIERGKVPIGSVLIVESLDRISRQDIDTSISLFMRITGQGIKIVTLIDGVTYEKKTDDPSERMSKIIYAVAVLTRSHDESLTKEDRSRKNWIKKRKNISEKKLTRICPSWLKLSDDRTEFEIIPERADVIKKIFQMSADGLGAFVIARYLNQQKVPPFTRGAMWHQSLICRLIRGRAVLGEYHPGHWRDGVRLSVGDPVLNYYPPIIDEALYYSANQACSERLSIRTGRRGKGIRNLFSGITWCSYCGNKFRYKNKGRGYSYFICESAQNGLECDSTGWKSDHLEKSILAFIQELDVANLTSETLNRDRLTVLNSELTICNGKLIEAKEMWEKTYNLIRGSYQSDRIGEKLAQLDNTINELESKIELLKAEKLSMTAVPVSYTSISIELKESIEKLNNLDDDNIQIIRSKIASKIKLLIESIHVAPSGHHFPLERENMNELERFDLTDERRSELLKSQSKNKKRTQHTRYFVVKMKDGTKRRIDIGNNDPLKGSAMITESTKETFSIIAASVNKEKQIQ